MRKAKKDAPLSCEIKGNQLIITVGVSTLAFAFEQSELPYQMEYQGKRPYVVDEQELAKDVKNALEREDEVGQSLLNKCLDDAIQDAIEDGSLGVEYANVSDALDRTKASH